MDLVFVGFVEEALGGSKPGLEAQLKMSPEPRPGTRVPGAVYDSCSKAGVLLLLYPRNGQLHLVLTRRTEQVESHQGQISLPGGRQEPGESLEQAALRETREELGIHLDSIRVLGELTSLYIPPSNYCIYPIVAFSSETPAFQPSHVEVAEVIEVPLAHLMEHNNVRKELWTFRGREMMVPFYAFRNHKIWGATAMVLAEFMVIAEKAFQREARIKKRVHS